MAERQRPNRWGSTNRPAAAYMAETAAALMWGPKTCYQVLQMVAPNSKNVSAVRKYVDQFVASGCAYEFERTARGVPVYAWNSKPFANIGPAAAEGIVTTKENP